VADAKITLSAVDATKAAFDSINRNMASLGAQAAALPGKFGSIGIAISSALGAVSLHNMVNVLDQLDAMAERTGISVGRLSELRAAALLTDTDLEALAVGFKKLSTNMADALGGGKEAQAKFGSIGITPEQLKNFKTADELFGAIADKFSKYEDGANKNALATELFGKRGEELIGTLNKGAAGIAAFGDEAKQLGAVFDGGLAKSASDFNDNLARLKLAAEGAKAAILSDLLPSLVALTSELVEGRKAFGSFLGALYEIGVKTSPFDNWSDGAKKSAADVARLNDEIAKLETGSAKVSSNAGGAAFVGPSGTSRSAARLKAARDELETAKKLQTYYDSLIKNSVTGEATRLEDIFNGGKMAAPVVAKPDATLAAAELKRYTDALQKLELQKGSLLHQTEYEKILYETETGSLAKLTEAHKDNLLAMAAEVDLVHQALLAKEFIRLNEDYNKSTQRSIDNLTFEVSLIGRSALEVQQLTAARQADLATQDQIIALQRKAVDDPSRKQQTDQEIAELERLTEARKKAISDTLEQTNRVRMDFSSGVHAGLAKYLDEVANVAAQTESLIGDSFKGMETALVDFVKTGKLDFSSLADSIISDLIRIQIRTNLTGPLAQLLQGSSWFGGGSGTIGGGGAGSSDFMGNYAASYAGGGDTGMGSRSGGLDGQGGFLAMLHPQETVIDHAQGQSTGKGIVYAPVINIGDHQEREVIYRNVNQMLRNGNAELVDQLTRSGRI
jgi:lambda family phage tail tape measure protein